MKTYHFVRLVADGRHGNFVQQVNACIDQHVAEGYHVHTLDRSAGDADNFEDAAILFEREEAEAGAKSGEW